MTATDNDTLATPNRKVAREQGKPSDTSSATTDLLESLFISTTTNRQTQGSSLRSRCGDESVDSLEGCHEIVSDESVTVATTSSSRRNASLPLLIGGESSLSTFEQDEGMEESASNEAYSDAQRIRQYRRTRMIRWSAVSGGLAGGFIAVGFLLFSLLLSTEWKYPVAFHRCPANTCPVVRGRRVFSVIGIQVYLDMFDWRRRPVEHKSTSGRRRRLALGGPSSLLTGSKSQPSSHLVIAGKMMVEGGPCNIAQYNLNTREWSLSERIQLSLYNSYSGGEVYSLLANHTTTSSADASSSSPSTKKQRGSGELLVVGAFDTTYRNSQVTYCSVGMWDGAQLSKVGEGLCNSALSKGMKITTASLAGPQDVYVAGSFQTQVWSGDQHAFVQIFNIAHFNAAEQVWLPLNVGQISCSWCTVTVLALAWDSKRRQLHVAGKFNSIDGRNVPAGLAIYDYDSGHLVAHPGGGLSMSNTSQDGVGTALQLDEDSGVLYVMGSFERLTQTNAFCDGLAAFEIEANRWTCLADAEHSVRPTGGGNMLLTRFGLMVAGKTTPSTTWRNSNRPYTIALLNATLKTRQRERHESADDDQDVEEKEQEYRDFDWSWLPGFAGHDEPLHALSNGFGSYEGSVFIAGDNLVARWSHQPASSITENGNDDIDAPQNISKGDTRDRHLLGDPRGASPPRLIPTTEIISSDIVRGAIMAISQMEPDADDDSEAKGKSSIPVNYQIIVYCVCLGAILGVIGAILCNRNISGAIFPFGQKEKDFNGFTLDTLTYSAMENTSMVEAYNRAMHTRYVHHPNLLTIIDPQEIFLQRIIGSGTFGRVWSAKWRSASVAVKEFVFAQAAVAGKSSMQQKIVEEIIGEAGMMAILRHPNVLQLFGCSLTAQAIWIVSELCSLGSLRQMLDDNDRVLPLDVRLSLALQVAEGMQYVRGRLMRTTFCCVAMLDFYFVHRCFCCTHSHVICSDLY